MNPVQHGSGIVVGQFDKQQWPEPVMESCD
jgi:hypothetical protein